jgi:hypothetical protein
MSDERRSGANTITRRIDIDNPDEVLRWTRSLAVTEDQLRDAVKNVGPEVVKVKGYLGQRVARP